MSRRFKSANRAQLFLLPPSIDDWIEEGHQVRFLQDCVEQFDLSVFTSAYSREGGAPYDPKMMLTALLYAWCLGIRSSRKIAAACRERIDLRWATGNLQPDHCAFARFFQRHGEAIRELFTQVLCLCAQAGAIRLGVLSLDGTKVGANAALSSNRTLSRLRREIERMEAEMREQDARDAARFGAAGGDELPDELRVQRERLARLRLAKERLELDLAAQRVLAQASQPVQAVGACGKKAVAAGACSEEQGDLPFGASSASSSECPSESETSAPGSGSAGGEAVAPGESSAGCVPEAPEAPAASCPSAAACGNEASSRSGETGQAAEAGPSGQAGQAGKTRKSGKRNKEARVNLTDPESRIMKARQGFTQGSNAQAVVTEEQFVVTCAVSQDENDLHQLEPMLQELTASLAAAGIEAKPKRLNADAGYWLQDLPIEALEKEGPELLIAPCNPRDLPKTVPRGRIPKSATPAERMKRKLSTVVGKKTYKKRSITVEPVFGQIKECLNGRRFLRRGLKKVSQEWSLLCGCLNLRKLFSWLEKRGYKSLNEALASG